ncbi:hypothetical protein FHL15_006466 [Xylaria flabelliformis]|uniref:Uncharacterized protein n=1 Tax=Xylaria flabelliformis TaxID=2512241 RepID=A0A553HX63_9PEZI|nr:hypothetical protein FHL15_006466 [Xylaria flabelliformis]
MKSRLEPSEKGFNPPTGPRGSRVSALMVWLIAEQVIDSSLASGRSSDLQKYESDVSQSSAAGGQKSAPSASAKGPHTDGKVGF